MRDLTATDPMMDDIGAMIDEAFDDPSRAAAMKARIAARLRRAAVDPAPSSSATEADGDDLWDNVPL